MPYLNTIDHVTQFLFSFVSQDYFLPFYKRILFYYTLVTILTEMQTSLSSFVYILVNFIDFAFRS